MRLTWRTFNNRISRRMVTLFVAAAVIPSLLLAALTLYQVRHKLIEQQSRQVRLSAKMIGMEIFQNLHNTTQQLHLIADNLNLGHALDFDSIETSHDSFEPNPISHLFRLDSQGAIIHLVGRMDLDGKRLLADIHQQRIPGKAMLLLSGGGADGPNLLLILPLDPRNPMGDLLGARLHLQSLLDTDQPEARTEQICVLSDSGIPIYCNKPYDMAWLTEVVMRSGKHNSQQFIWHPPDNEEKITAFWSVFLAPHYQMQKWSVVVAQPRQFITASAREFEMGLLAVGLVTLMLVTLLSIFAIRRNMIPLEHLLKGTRHLSKGLFNTRVDIRSDDEFSELGAAFNDMAEKLGDSFDKQAALIDLNYNLQHDSIINGALITALESLPHFTDTDSQGVIFLESSKTVVHADGLYRRNGAVAEHSASYPLSQVDIPLMPWQGTAVEAAARLPIIDAFGLPPDMEITLMPALVKNQVVACLALQFRTSAAPAMEKFFLLTQFCDILATSLSNIRLKQRLEYQAYHDPLTDLPNRMLIRQKTELAMQQARQGGYGLALMILDIDRFKIINDSMGHAAGDELLIQVADRLKQVVSRRDMLCRFAGDEFVILFSIDKASPQTLWPEVIARLDYALVDPFVIGNRKVRITASKGIAGFPDDGENFLDLLKNADAAMYRAKHQKAGSYAFFDHDLQRSLLDEMETEQALIDALARMEFELHYQPCVNLSSGKVKGAEALIRWRRPGHGLVSPGNFIPLAERTGLIEPIGNWALKHSCENFLRWRQQGFLLDSISVNVSSLQLQESGFVSTVAQILQFTGMPAQHLELEITETAFIEDFDDSLEKLKELRALGVRIAVDDFGTGYASLRYLKELPANHIKIDRLFIKGLPESQDDIAIISALITLSGKLNLGLVAEGIETQAQKQYLRAAGITLAQGYLMSKPLPETEFLEFLRQRQSAILSHGTP